MSTHPTSAQFGFTTMGCPDISFTGLVSLAREYKMDFVELRALEGVLDLPRYFAEHPVSVESGAVVPEVRLIASHLKLMEATENDIQEFLGFVDVAVMLHAPYVRVFGGGKWGEPLSAQNYEHATQTLQQCRNAIAKKSAPCEILLETHSAFSSSTACLELNERIDAPLAILWDSHHTWRSAGESPAQTWGMIGSLVRHIHFSDSRLRELPDQGHEWVVPGRGEYPVQLLRQLLSEQGYNYGVSLEWEKIWHPHLPDIPVALRAFQQLFELPG